MKLSLLSSALLVALVGLVSCQANKPPLTEAQAKEQVQQAITEAIEADAQGEDQYIGYYLDSLKIIESKCAEPISTTVRLTIEQAETLGYLGEQFAWLNTLEATANELQDSQGIVNCTTIIAGLTY